MCGLLDGYVDTFAWVGGVREDTAFLAFSVWMAGFGVDGGSPRCMQWGWVGGQLGEAGSEGFG